MRSDRIAEWLQSLGYGRWERAALAGDASARRYERLADGAGQSVILMDAPPDKVSSTSDFLRLADFLSAHGLAAPAILHAEPEAGLVLLEDLGTTHFADWLTNRPADEAVLYAEATDALLAVQHLGLPAGLTTLDPETAAEMVTVAFDWLPNTADEEMQRTIGAGIRSAVATLSDRRQVLSLRDFHAENLIWRPDREGTDRVGLLDFQDAFGAPPAYDLASLLRDARRDVADDTANAMIDRFATATGNRSEAVARDVAILSVQRNLRILGVFARLAKRDGKHRYQGLMPRIWDHLRKDLAHPDLADLRGSLQNAFEELSE
jgi:hypothetical protein